MNLLRILIFGCLLLTMSAPSSAADSPNWIILQYTDNGFPIVMKVMEGIPKKQVRERFPWLTVISWRYDPSENNGMPKPDVNSQMKQLEASIDLVEGNGLCVQVYSKTGNGLKELVYYIANRDEFMRAFNLALSDQPKYPLEIEFFEDSDWGDLQTVHDVYIQNE